MRKKICFVVAVPITAQAFLKDHIKLLSEQYDIYLVGNINSDDDVKELAIAGWKKIDIERGISISKDLSDTAFSFKGKVRFYFVKWNLSIIFILLFKALKILDRTKYP